LLGLGEKEHDRLAIEAGHHLKGSIRGLKQLVLDIEFATKYHNNIESSLCTDYLELCADTRASATWFQAIYGKDGEWMRTFRESIKNDPLHCKVIEKHDTAIVAAAEAFIELERLLASKVGDWTWNKSINFGKVSLAPILELTLGYETQRHLASLLKENKQSISESFEGT